MTVSERLADISARAGFSEEIVRKVLNAERESILESLKHGERATLIGRATIIPSLRTRLSDDKTHMETYIKPMAQPANIIVAELARVNKYEAKEEDTSPFAGIPNVMVQQIDSLL